MAVTIDKRTIKRSRMLLVAAVEAGGSAMEVRIRDVSNEGALLEASEPPARGETVRLHCGPSSAEARVAWVDGSWFGLEFTSPLKSGFLVDSQGSKLKVSAPRGYRHDQVPEDDDEAVEVAARVMRLRNTLR